MDAITEVVAETGILKGRRRRAVDSTVLDDAVARQDTVTQLIAAVRRFVRDVPGGKDLLAAHATGYDYTRTGKPDIAWDDPDAKDALVSALVADALALLAAVDPEALDGKAADAYALLALVAGQDVEPADGSDGTDGRWNVWRSRYCCRGLRPRVNGHSGGGAEDARTSSEGENTSIMGSNSGSLDRSMAISAARRPRSTGCRSTVVRSTPGNLLADVLS